MNPVLFGARFGATGNSPSRDMKPCSCSALICCLCSSLALVVFCIVQDLPNGSVTQSIDTAQKPLRSLADHESTLPHCSFARSVFSRGRLLPFLLSHAFVHTIPIQISTSRFVASCNDTTRESELLALIWHFVASWSVILDFVI